MVRAHWSQLPTGEQVAFRFLHVSTDEVHGLLGPTNPAFSDRPPTLSTRPRPTWRTPSTWPRRANWLTAMQRLLRERKMLAVVDDQFGAPTWSRLMAEATALVVARWLDQLDQTSSSGIYHLSCGGRTSWHGFTAAIRAQLADTDAKLARLTAIPTGGYPTPAARPANSQLNCDKLAETFGVRLPDWETALTLCLNHDFQQSTK